MRRTAERATARRPKVQSSDASLDGIEHRPTVLMAFIGATALSGAVWSWLGGHHALALAGTALLITAFIGRSPLVRRPTVDASASGVGH